MAELHGFEIGPINKSNKPNKPIDKQKGGNVMKKSGNVVKKCAVVKKGRQQWQNGDPITTYIQWEPILQGPRLKN